MHEMMRAICLLGICYFLCLCLAVEALADMPKPADTVLLPSFEIPQPPLEATESAEKGKKSLERLAITDKYARELGFDSKSQAADRNTKLGVAFPLIVVNFTMLKNYDPSMGLKTLLIFTRRFIYPVVFSEQVKSSVTVLELTSPKKSTQGWKPVEWGAPGLIGLLHKARIAAGSERTSFVLWIPQLSRYFLGDITGGQFSIIPLYDEKDYGFSAGIPKTAKEVLRIIAVEAKHLSVVKHQ